MPQEPVSSPAKVIETTENEDQTKPRHVPPSICRQDLQAGKMKPSAYSMEAVCDALVDHLSQSKDQLTNTQKDAMERYKYQGSWNLARPINLEDLRKFYNLFNNIFFNGILTGYCVLNTYKGAFHWLDGEKAYCNIKYKGHWTGDPSFKREHTTITLMFQEREPEWDPCVEIQTILGYLLHEMCHAALCLFTCQCTHGCQETIEVERAFFYHGPFFQTVAHAIENACLGKDCAQLFNTELDLERGSSMLPALRDAVEPEEPGLSQMVQDMGLDMKEFMKSLSRENESQEKKNLIERNCVRLEEKNVCVARCWTEGGRYDY
ncbi:hypothetical protein EG329_000553 [Mollisiaceae sp. DMI_Dod_QoI]|nr:hypothetical protein EG329_000553 [Helotiales sp. DMI_Dod_QoI]